MPTRSTPVPVQFCPRRLTAWRQEIEIIITLCVDHLSAFTPDRSWFFCPSGLHTFLLLTTITSSTNSKVAYLAPALSGDEK